MRLAAIGSVAILVAACAPRGTALRTEAVEASLERARARLDGHAAGRRALDEAWHRARAATAFDAGRQRWFPWAAPESPAAWEEATRVAWQAMRNAQTIETDATARWRRLEEEARRLLSEARTSTSRHANRPLTRELQLAAGALARARGWEARGQLMRAAAEAERSRGHSLVALQGSDRLEARVRDPELLRQWAAWVDGAIELSRRAGESAIVVDKLRRRLYLYERGVEVRFFAVELGSRGLERKLHAGDRATPEGLYRVTERRERGQTRFYKALLLDYPNSEDERRFREAIRRGEIPPHSRIGGLIEIHGEGGRDLDWTQGCIALTNQDMDRIFEHAPVGTSVTVVGARP
jgi:hypothetical protein